MSSPKPPAQLYPHDELEALDKRNIARLLSTQAEYQAFYRKHPFFETDPLCRLARQMCLDSLPEHDRKEGADRLVVNASYQPSDGPRHLHVNMGPGPSPDYREGRWSFPDFLIAGSRPRPIWMAWIPQARAAIAARETIEAADA